MTPCKQDGVSPLINASRFNLRTMSARQRERLEITVEERHGWALQQSLGKVQDLQQELEEEQYEHLLSQEALSLRMKKQKQKDKDSLMKAEGKRLSLHDLVVAAERSCVDAERQLRVETSEVEKALRRCEALEAANAAVNMALVAKCVDLENTNAKYIEAEKEAGRLRREVRHLQNELGKKCDDIKAQTKQTAQQELTFKKKLAIAEVRVETFKTEAKDVALRMASLLHEVQKDKEEQRRTINLLQTNLERVTKEVLDQQGTLRQRELKWERQLQLSKKEALKAAADRDTVEAKLAELLEDRRNRITIRESGVRGNPVNDKFARHVRGLLASGASAASTVKQLSLNARFFLNDEDYSHFVHDMPQIRWFQYQREGLGLESYLYTLSRLAKCERVLQWGFDETSLDGVATLNQWVRIKEGDDLHIVTLECAGLLVGSTASKVAAHVRLHWERGQEAIAMLREELGAMADVFVPLVKGGISLSKLGGVMHDTCNCANAIARKVRVLRNDSGKELYGDEEWKRMAKEEHAWCDYFCGNHSRNVHFDAFSRLYEAYIKRKLGVGLEAARLKSGGRVRVEASGDALLRTICKLTHLGPKQYAKGTIFLLSHLYSSLTNSHFFSR